MLNCIFFFAKFPAVPEISGCKARIKIIRIQKIQLIEAEIVDIPIVDLSLIVNLHKSFEFKWEREKC